MISQLVCTGIDESGFKDVVLPILSAPGLTISHCDRVIALLNEHDTLSVDSYNEGLRAEYLSSRATLHQLVHDQKNLRREYENFGNKAGPSIVAEIAEPTLYSVQSANAPIPRPDVKQQTQALAAQLSSLKNIKELDDLMARTNPAELAEQVENLNRAYRVYFQAADSPYPEQIRKVSEEAVFPEPTNVRTQVTRGLLPATASFAQRLAQSTALTRNTQGLVAVRRWQLGHGGALPSTLSAAVKEAGLPVIPRDPYDGQPTRFSVVDGRPTVYCVGPDGQDDGGKSDVAKTPQFADVLLRLGDVLMRLPKR